MTPGQESVLTRRGERSGLPIAIAVDSTLLGPALGGCRMWRYDRPADGVADASRLARAMTLKAAAAGLDLGGGKGVICLDGRALDPGARSAALLDFAEAVESLEGAYITAEDVGTTAEDMAVISEGTDHVVGLPPRLGGRGDPSPLTARGVMRAIEACSELRFGAADLAGMRVCVIGLGHVGSHLARLLAFAGADLVVSDIDPARRELAEELGGRWVAPDDAMLTPCEVVAPCALGGAVDERNAGSLRCQVLCGAANNVLASESLAADLSRQRVLYAPDFIANAGGLIHVYAELRGLEPEVVEDLVDSIGETIREVLEAAEESSATPLQAARALALRRLEAAPARAA